MASGEFEKRLNVIVAAWAGADCATATLIPKSVTSIPPVGAWKRARDGAILRFANMFPSYKTMQHGDITMTTY
jgi:hypothetical protein